MSPTLAAHVTSVAILQPSTRAVLGLRPGRHLHARQNLLLMMHANFTTDDAYDDRDSANADGSPVTHHDHGVLRSQARSAGGSVAQRCSAKPAPSPQTLKRRGTNTFARMPSCSAHLSSVLLPEMHSLKAPMSSCSSCTYHHAGLHLILDIAPSSRTNCNSKGLICQTTLAPGPATTLTSQMADVAGALSGTAGDAHALSILLR